jgi:hypothetical protein
MLDATGPQATRANRGTPRVQRDDLDEWTTLAREAHERLRADGDANGALACAAAVLARLHGEVGAPPAMDRWIDAFDNDLARAHEASSSGLDSYVFRAALAVLGRRPTHPSLPLWQARARAFVERSDVVADDAIRAAQFAFEYAVRAGSFPLASDIVKLARLHGTEASAAMRRSWLEAEALEAWLNGDHARAHRAVADALDLGAGYSAWEQGASAAISEGNLPEADRCLAGMTATIDPRRVQDVAHALFLGAARARLANDNDEAHQRLEACLARDATNVPAYFTTLWLLGRAHLDVARGRHRQAAAALSVVLAHATTRYWSFLHFSALMSRTWLRIRQRRHTEAALDLQSALALARTGTYCNCDPWWDREAIDAVARFAATIPHDSATWSKLLARGAPAP